MNVLHKPPRPLLVVVSGSGKLELGRAIFRMPEARTVVMTTPAGKDALTMAALRNCLPFRYMLWIPVLERSTRWRCCDCSTCSMGYEVSSMKAALHFSENLWQHKLLTNSTLLCRRKSRAERLTQCGLRSYKERSSCRSVPHGFNCSASSKAQTTCICGTSETGERGLAIG